MKIDKILIIKINESARPNLNVFLLNLRVMYSNPLL